MLMSAQKNMTLPYLCFQKLICFCMFCVYVFTDWIKNRFGKDQSVLLIYEDQAGNDFNSLMARLYGMTCTV